MPRAKLLSQSSLEPCRQVPIEEDIDVTWQLADGAPCQEQALYDVEVRDTGAPSTIPPVWESGSIASADQTAVLPMYALSEMRTYSVRVRIAVQTMKSCLPIDKDSGSNTASVISPWSSPFVFDTGLSTSSWKGSQWIGGYRRIRTQFNLTNAGRISRARAYIVGLGAFVLKLNGKQVRVDSLPHYQGEKVGNLFRQIHA